ncbi:ComF family protein [Macrococcus bovicus]|uniref:ComF family protein n=2 Tax=Macrococcus bovicus TaxID=69968 RepID=A0A4R6C0W8_9STAP|nr:ComF family protein [Macrococcus bovicus]
MDRLKCLVCLQPVSEPLFLSNYFSPPRIICMECEAAFEQLQGQRCPHCHRLLVDEKTCSDCRFMHQYFKPLDRIQILYDYNDFMKEVIHAYKGRGDIKLARVFAYLLRGHLSYMKSFDAVIALPTSDEKLKQRGFSQMEEILSHLPVPCSRCLTMSSRLKQSELTKKERLKQVNPFAVSRPVDGRILLIDDIYTTGLTVHHAAEVLRAQGVHTVEVLTFARP